MRVQTAETRAKISAAFKGIKPAGFYILKKCPVCGVEMNAPNLGRHQPACEKKSKNDRFPNKTVKQMKYLRRKLRVYGMTADEYADLREEQNDVCRICHGDNNGKDLAVDHCHETDEIRGLLCLTCNVLLGCAKDKIETLENAKRYLEQHRGLLN